MASEIDCGAAQLRTNYDNSASHYPVTSPPTYYFFPANQTEKNSYPSINVTQSIQYEFGSSHCDGSSSHHTDCDLVGFWIANAATEAQYHYTPFVQTDTTGTHGGVFAFEKFWQQYDSVGWKQ